MNFRVPTTTKSTIEPAIKHTVQYQVYCGMNINNGKVVSDLQLDLFIQRYVVPYIDSFSLSYTEGYWRGCKEKTAVFTFIDIEYERVYIVAQKYKQYFTQEAVLITETAAYTALV